MEEKELKFTNDINPEGFLLYQKKTKKDFWNFLIFMSVINLILIIVGVWFNKTFLIIGITLELFSLFIFLLLIKEQKSSLQKSLVGLGDNFIQEITLYDDHMFIKETSSIRYGTVNFEYKLIENFYEFESIMILTICAQIIIINKKSINDEIENFIKIKAYENSLLFQGKQTKQIKDINKYLKH